MRIRRIVIASALAIAAPLLAQTMPTVCLAKFEGAESQNWNLRPSVARELSREFVEQRRELQVLTLEAGNAKHAAAEAADKHCDFVVYSNLDRVAEEVNSQMNADIKKRGLANPDGTAGTSMLRFSFSIKNASRSKIADGKVQTKLLPNFGPKEYELSGRALVSDIVEKIASAVPKQ